ncbi:MAG: hypothetical protein J6U96_00055 [Elusimicrobiaceae bacterium]|nr:hypothetical protein [Elusimicrobiaceae bacterium]
MKYARLLTVCALALCLAGCFSLTDKQEKTNLPTPAQGQQLFQQKKQALQDKKPQFSLPDTLGGVVSSERWIVYQEKQEEEFIGNVHYDNGQYIFKAGYALSQRKKNLITAKENVFIRYNAEDGVWYQLKAEQARYNYQTGEGSAKAARRKLIELQYHTAQNELMKAYGQKAQFNTQLQTFELDGKAKLIYTDAQGQTITLQADHITARQQDQYALLKGHAQADNGQYRLQADTLEYDGTTQQAYAYGDRPLATGATDEGTFAIIADKVSAHTDSQQIKLEGQVQGWVVADKINQSKASKDF